MSVLSEAATRTMSVDDAFERLASVDLAMVRSKLADPAEGQGWNAADLDLYEREYRRFLALNLMYPGASIVPCHAVDMVWHAHILDTAAYRVDCEAAFGQFFDHFPYFGLRGEKDAADLATAYDQTLDLYVANFGDLPDGVWTVEHTMKCKRTACKPQKCRGAQ